MPAICRAPARVGALIVCGAALCSVGCYTSPPYGHGYQSNPGFYSSPPPGVYSPGPMPGPGPYLAPGVSPDLGPGTTMPPGSFGPGGVPPGGFPPANVPPGGYPPNNGVPPGGTFAPPINGYPGGANPRPFEPTPALPRDGNYNPPPMNGGSGFQPLPQPRGSRDKLVPQPRDAFEETPFGEDAPRTRPAPPVNRPVQPLPPSNRGTFQNEKDSPPPFGQGQVVPRELDSETVASAGGTQGPVLFVDSTAETDGARREGMVVAASATVSSDAAEPAPVSLYSYDKANYQWLCGSVDYDETQENWFIIYNLAPDESDLYQGGLTLAATDGVLADLKNGDFVVVKGAVDEQQVDRRNAPLFRVTEATVVRR